MELLTERLLITHPREKDVFQVFSHRLDSPANLFTGGVTSLSWPEFQADYLSRCEQGEEKKKHLYSVILRESDTYIGYCGFQHCPILGAVEILYGYSSPYWGNGYALEAAKAVLSHGMETPGFERIEAAVNPGNPVSESILRKIGMEFASQIEWPGQGMVNRYVLTKERYPALGAKTTDEAR